MDIGVIIIMEVTNHANNYYEIGGNIMNYIGGKFRQGKHIASVVVPHINNKIYIEPFCGAMGSATAIIDKSIMLGVKSHKIILNDCQEILMNMWIALMNGWIPQDIIDQDTYDYYKNNRHSIDPMTAYVGYGMSFGGKYFGGYARNGHGKEHALNTKRSTLLKASTLLKTSILLKTSTLLKTCDYKCYADVSDAVFYLDPPYAGRTRQFKGSFDNNEFWEFARKLSINNTVFITEFNAPLDFKCILNFGDTVVRHHKSNGADGTTEGIFVHESKIEGIRRINKCQLL